MDLSVARGPGSRLDFDSGAEGDCEIVFPQGRNLDGRADRNRTCDLLIANERINIVNKGILCGYAISSPSFSEGVGAPLMNVSRLMQECPSASCRLTSAAANPSAGQSLPESFNSRLTKCRSVGLKAAVSRTASAGENAVVMISLPQHCPGPRRGAGPRQPTGDHERRPAPGDPARVPAGRHTDKTVGYETLQSMECLILLSKASDHVVYPTVLAVMHPAEVLVVIIAQKALPEIYRGRRYRCNTAGRSSSLGWRAAWLPRCSPRPCFRAGWISSPPRGSAPQTGRSGR